MLFSKILGNSTEIVDKRSAIVAVIYMYSAALLAVAVLIAVFVEDEKKSAAKDEKVEVVQAEKFKLSDIVELFKNKFVYLQGGIVFMGYAVFWTVYYLGGFLETNIGVDPVTVSKIMVIVLWMRPVGGIIGGFLADKLGKAVTNGGALLGAAVCLLITALLPASIGQGVFFTVIVLLGIFLYAIRGTYWSLLGDAKIDALIMGTAIGAISFIGYLPDIILPQFNSFLFNTFGGNGGYNAYFISSAVIGVIGLVLVFGRMTSKEQSMKSKSVNKSVS